MDLTTTLPPLAALSRTVSEREATPVQIVTGLLARVADRDSDLRAWAYVAAAEARKEAQKLEQELAAGKRRGPLHGIPFGIKDIFDTAGVPTGWGCPLYADRIPNQDAELVARLKQAGAIALGKTHTTAFAYFDPAPTRNPHNPAHTPGGSSSGSAAAVADGMVPFALGSQTLGSVLRPASFCGVVGLKPTFGALPLGGVLAFAPTLDHAGLFTRTAGEMAWLWATVAGNPQASAVAHRRLAWLRWPIESELEPEMALGFEQAIVTLARAGFEIQEIPLPASFQQLPGATMTVFQYEGAQTNKDRFQQYGLRIGEKLAALVENGLRIDDGRYEQALAQLEEARQAFARSVREHPVWITPSALGPAPVGLASTGDPRANAPFTALGVPAISLPFGKTTSGLPLGLQLAAGCGQESGLLATAAECEKGLAEQDGQARE